MDVTNTITKSLLKISQCFILLILSPLNLHAAVLDDDRVDILYQTYDGGGVEVDAPAILVRKRLGNSVAVSANYLVDKVSGASIDVEVGASPYDEERKEYGAGIEYLRDKSTLSLNYSNSTENDYDAESMSLSVTQDFYGDLSTLNLGLSLGNDDIGSSQLPSFAETAKHYSMDLGWTQILWKNLIMNVSFNKTVDEGYLQNPYRFIRYDDGLGGWTAAPEEYPDTRSSDAWSLRVRYHVHDKKVIYLGYRQFQDTWNIKANDYHIGFATTLFKDWTFDIKWRTYEQTAADFYSDLFPFADPARFYGRDKELSTFNTETIGFAVSYEIPVTRLDFIKKSSVHLMLDRVDFDYEDFRDVRVNKTAGTEPLYAFSANMIRLMLSVGF